MIDITTIAFYTFKEILKSRIIFYVLLLGVALCLISYIASEFTFGVPSRVALDFGLGTLSLTCIAVSLFLGAGLVSTEIENRTIYMILSRPVSRSSFLLGRILGMIWIQFLNFLIMGGLSLFTFVIYEGKLDSLIFWTFTFVFIESLLVLLLVVLFSLLTNRIISVANTFIILFCGYVLNDTKTISFVLNNKFLKMILTFYGYIFPNFYRLNLKDFVLYDQNLSTSYLWTNLIYGFCYSLFLILLSCFIFNRKNLD